MNDAWEVRLETRRGNSEWYADAKDEEHAREIATIAIQSHTHPGLITDVTGRCVYFRLG